MKINKKLIITIVFLIAASAAAVFLTVPAGLSIINIKAEISQKESELSAIKDSIEKTNQIKKQGKNIEKELAEVFSALPKEKDIPDLLVYFESLSITNGLILESIDLGQIDEETENGQKLKNHLKSRQVSLIVSGSYEAFKKYLHSLENNVRSMNLSSISFSGRQSFTGPESDFLRFNLKVEVFYQ
jgi:Tfp pilus assembly protein PilO